MLRKYLECNLYRSNFHIFIIEHLDIIRNLFDWKSPDINQHPCHFLTVIFTVDVPR